MLAWWSSAMIRARWLVLAAGLAAAVAGIAWGSGVFASLTNGGFDDPASESAKVQRIAARLGVQSPDVVVLYSSRRATVNDPAFRRPVSATLQASDHRPDNVRHRQSMPRRGSVDRRSQRNQGPAPGVQGRGGIDLMKSRKRHLALMACLAASLTACATTAPRHAANAAPATVRSPAPDAHTRAGCPLGRPLPPRQAIMIDYVDFLRFGGHGYVAGAEPAGATRLGRVITHVRCSLAAEDDYRHSEPPLIDGTASYLEAGSPVYQVRGYPPNCRLAAYLRGRLQTYIAQITVDHHAAPMPCASSRLSAGPSGVHTVSARPPR
jgi:hypothetical protein